MKNTVRHRPRHRFAGVLLAATLLATGCSANPAASETPAASSELDSTISTVDTAFGAVQIPKNPERVIALEGGTVPAVEAGIIPIANAGDTFDDSFADPSDFKKVEDLPAVLGPDGWDYEKIVELKPDLLIGFVRGGDDASVELSAEKKADFEKLNAIAPTVFIRTNGSAGVRDATVEISSAMGNADAAQEAKTTYEAKVSQVAADYSTVISENTFAAVNAYEDVTVYSQISWIGAILKDLQAPPTKVVASEASENGVFLSFEQISRIDDATIVLYPEYLDGSSDALDVLAGQKTFTTLPAVKAKQSFGLTHFFPDNYGAATRVVEQVEEILKGL